MSLYIRDGFEHNNLGLYTTSGSPTIVTSPVRTGIRGLEINPSAAAEYVEYSLPAGSRVVTQSFYVRFATPLPSANVMMCQFINAGLGNASLRFNGPTGKFQALIGTGVDGGPSIVIDTWYLIDIELDTSTGTATNKVKVDGGTEFQDSAASSASDTTAIRMGSAISSTMNAHYDDWGVSITDGDYPIGAHAYTDPTLTLRVGPDRRPGV